MSPFEYLLPLVSVLVGLAVADLATSLHRLLRARARVRWDWLPLATALIATLSVLNLWWGLYGVQEDPHYRTLLGFLPLAAQLVLLFLLNAAALPDDVPPEGVDLRAFYENNSTYFWLLAAAYVLVILVAQVGGLLTLGLRGDRVGVFTGLFPNLGLLGLCVSLSLVRRRSFHAVAVGVLLVLLIAFWSRMRLGAA